MNASFCFQQAQSAGRCQIHFLYRGTAATAPGPWATWEMLSTCSLWEHILFSSGWSGWKPLTAQKCTLVYKYKYKVDLSSGQDKVLSLSCHSYQFPLISSCHAQTRAQTCTPKWSSWEPHHWPIPLWVHELLGWPQEPFQALPVSLSEGLWVSTSPGTASGGDRTGGFKVFSFVLSIHPHCSSELTEVVLSPITQHKNF